jgi:hypothetical protein
MKVAVADIIIVLLIITFFGVVGFFEEIWSILA